MSRFEIINNGRVSVVCWGSRNPARASRVDVEIINAMNCRASLMQVPHCTGRRWVYPEPGGGFSPITPTMRSVIANVLPELTS